MRPVGLIFYYLIFHMFLKFLIKKENGSRNYRAKRYIAELIRNKEEMELREKERIESLIDSGQAHQYKLWDYVEH